MNHGASEARQTVEPENANARPPLGAGRGFVTMIFVSRSGFTCQEQKRNPRISQGALHPTPHNSTSWSSAAFIRSVAAAIACGLEPQPSL